MEVHSRNKWMPLEVVSQESWLENLAEGGEEEVGAI
jgi:hypothetical protein